MRKSLRSDAAAKASTTSANARSATESAPTSAKGESERNCVGETPSTCPRARQVRSSRTRAISTRSDIGLLVFEDLTVVVSPIFINTVGHDVLGTTTPLHLVDLRKLRLPLRPPGTRIASRHLAFRNSHVSLPLRHRGVLPRLSVCDLRSPRLSVSLAEPPNDRRTAHVDGLDSR